MSVQIFSLEHPSTMTKTKLFWIYSFGFLYLQTISALKITSLDVPKTAWDAVNLQCKYELEDDENLYAVKWYKDGKEFFRCFANGTIQQFPSKDIKIFHTDRSQLGSCFFELTALTPKSGGDYTCEVGLEWPTFLMVTKTAHLNVIEPSRIVQPEVTTAEEILTLPGERNTGSKNILSTVEVFITLYIIYTIY